MQLHIYEEASMPKLTLISHDLCPYVQRAVIALMEKGVPFERRYVDLANKPDWFLAISPLGKVPLLQAGDAVIFESAVILEYLEETQANPLHPADPLARAQHRTMIEFGSAVLSDIWGLEIAPTREAAVARIEALREKFARLEQSLGAGPWFAGDRFGLVDAAFGPVFRYRSVRPAARSRDFRRQAESRGLARGAGGAPVDSPSGGRRLSRAARALRGEPERLPRRAHGQAGGVTRRRGRSAIPACRRRSA
jgi:glutathione S-transferase